MKIARLRQPALSALAVLLISGAGIAFAGNSSTNHRAAVAPVAIQAAAPAEAVTASAVEPADTDTLQEGDQTTPDTAAESAAEKAGAETEKAGAESDGPGGHADDPSDPNADHQFEGEE
ncbi:MAG: hypothetical protein ABI562_04795 [Chloroflexota bacterium]